MKPVVIVAVLFGLFVLGALPRTAAADTQVSLIYELELTPGRIGQPMSFAPDARHDLNDKLAIALVHSRYATTGMRAFAGASLCRSRVACDDVYDNVGAEAHFLVYPQIVVIGGVHFLDIDEVDLGLKIGARLHHRLGRITLHTTPAVMIPETLWIPFGADVRVAGGLVLGISTGLTAPLDALGDWHLPLAGTIDYAFHRMFAVGLSYAFSKLVGGAEQPVGRAPIYGSEHRVAQAWLRVTW
jgi:hypothetical protein